MPFFEGAPKKAPPFFFGYNLGMTKPFKEKNSDAIEFKTSELKHGLKPYSVSIISKLHRYLSNDNNLFLTVKNSTVDARLHVLLLVFLLPLSYCTAFVVFGCRRFITFGFQIHDLSITQMRIAVALIAGNTYGRFAVGGALICVLTLWTCHRCRKDRVLSAFLALLLSSLITSLCFGAWELPQFLAGSPIDWKFISYYIFLYLPEYPGAGGLCGGLSVIATLVIFQSLRSKLDKIKE